MRHVSLTIPALVAETLLLPCLTARDASKSFRLESVVFEGGSREDHGFASAALGLRVGQTLTVEDVDVALAAVRATDRFRSVQRHTETLGVGTRLRVCLEPWPVMRDWRWEGDPPSVLKRASLPGWKRNCALGDFALEEIRLKLQEMLRTSGYPEGTCVIRREERDHCFVIAVQAGAPSLVVRCDVTGDLEPYTRERLLSVARIEPGRTIWTETFRRRAESALRRRFTKDRRLEGRAELIFSPDGTLRLDVVPGPVVRVRVMGPGLAWKRVKDLVPLANAERYSPALMDEGDRRILRHLRAKGYLDARVTHAREVLEGSAERPQKVQLTYRADSGPRYTIDGLRFEGNANISSRDLASAVSLPSRWVFVGAPLATPEILASIEDRVRDYYRSQGFSDVKLQGKFPLRGEGRTDFGFKIREERRDFIRRIRITMPIGPMWDTWALAETSLKVFADRIQRDDSSRSNTRRYRSDRPTMDERVAVIEDLGVLTSGVHATEMSLDQPIPLVKADLAQILALLRAQVAALGSQNPQVNLRLEQQEGDPVVVFDIPEQEISYVRRMVVQGSYYTRAAAVLRNAPLGSAEPLTSDRLARYQGNLGNLGAFQRVDLGSMAGMEDAVPGRPWGPEDLCLQLDERSRWVFNTGFGYDNSQGYYVMAGAQRLNLMGMGRTLDFGIRAGDATLSNPTLRRWFPTGEFVRSMDVYSVAYTDPNFCPAFLEHWIKHQTHYRVEAAYVEENRNPYLIRRRRVTNELEWHPTRATSWQIGHRFERVDVSASVPDISDEDLNRTIRNPTRTIISAPFVQYVRDRRDNAFDPTEGHVFSAKLELANQLWGTSKNSSFVKLDVKQQWNWAIGYRAAAGVLSLSARVGAMEPTESHNQDIPLSERFFAGGPFTHRGVEPDFLGPLGTVPLRQTVPPYDFLRDPETNAILQRTVPLGGQGMVLLSAEYRFPILGRSIWGEIFCDTGQVYQRLFWKKEGQDVSTLGDVVHYPPFRTALGLGVILKIGLPIKIEYAADVKRILGRPRTQQDRDVQLKRLLVSAGFQF